MADIAKDLVPGWGLFPVGLAVLLVAFKAFDRALPDLSAERLEEGGNARQWFRKPWGMFALGCGVALMTLSVSVALTLLVPLVAKGHLKRDETLPYIAGANITTLADTLVAAMLVSNPDAARVVLAEMVGVTAWTLVLIGFLYPAVRRTALRIARTVLSSRSRLAASIAGLFSVPLLLVAL
jgi:Na+/phosphate symporter